MEKKNPSTKMKSSRRNLKVNENSLVMNVDQSSSGAGSFFQTSGEEVSMEVDLDIEYKMLRRTPSRYSYELSDELVNVGNLYTTDKVQSTPKSSTLSAQQNDTTETVDSGFNNSGDLKRLRLEKSFASNKWYQPLFPNFCSPQRMNNNKTSMQFQTTPKKNKRLCMIGPPKLPCKKTKGSTLAESHSTPKTNFNLYTPKSREKKKNDLSECGKKLCTTFYFPKSSTGRFKNEFKEIGDLGNGNFGNVFHVENRLNGCEYAIKKIEHCDNKIICKNIVKEVQVLSALSLSIRNKHIVQYYSSWNEGDTFYIQMEYCRNGTLEKRIKDLKRNNLVFNEDQVLHCLRHMLKALRVIHSYDNKSGLAHRDIKPENILVHNVNVSAEREGFPIYKLADFGHLSYADDHSGDQGDSRYLSKEALDDEEVDKSKVDIFALALTIYECGTLIDMPKEGDLYQSLRNEPLPNVKNFDEEFNKVLQQMAHSTFSERPSAQELLKLPLLFSPAKKRAHNLRIKYEQLLKKNLLQESMENSF